MVSTVHYVVPSACILDFYRLVLSCAKQKATLFAFQNQNADIQQVLKSSVLIISSLNSSPHCNKVIVSYSGCSCLLASIHVILQQVVGSDLLS